MPGKYGQSYRHTECYACHHYDFFPNQCPDKQSKLINLEMIGVILMQNGNVIKKTWILLDTCSTDSAPNNLDYVEDVKNCDKHEELIVLKMKDH